MGRSEIQNVEVRNTGAENLERKKTPLLNVYTYFWL